MPQRVTSVVFLATGVAGLLLLAGLALWRIDPEAWARTGPRWRRRLVAAGLAILAATGVAPAQPAASRPVGNAPAATAPARKDLARTPEWGHLAAAWTQAEEALHFARGLYPFDQKGQRALLDSLNLALKDVDALLAMDCLSAPEAGLLKEDLQDLIREIADRRPSDPDGLVSCYEPILGVTYHTAEAAEALSKRLLLLEKLASARTVQPEVIYKVLATAEDQVRQIDGEGLKQMPEDARAKAVQSREAAKAHLPRIRAKVAGPFRTAGGRGPTSRCSGGGCYRMLGAGRSSTDAYAKTACPGARCDSCLHGVGPGPGDQIRYPYQRGWGRIELRPGLDRRGAVAPFQEDAG
ncbi:MAG: hypothetical protein NTV86_10060 [Planctomycetota bacterium]|nr:hypothetical protein [Planctomycetota bacterium]